MGQITHPNLGSPCAMVTPEAELVITGSRSFTNGNYLGKVHIYNSLTNGSEVGPASLDDATFTMQTMEYEHHEIHDGNHYFISNFATIGSGIGSSLVFGVTTANGSKWVHFVYDMTSTLQTEAKMWEGATLSGGIAISAYNNNRNSTNNTSLTLMYNPVISGAVPTSGILISSSSWGTATATPSKTGVGGASTRDKELILKSGTTYLIQVTSATADNLISYDANWYEHTDKIKKW